MLYLLVPGCCVFSLPRLLISPCHGGFLGHPDNIWHGRQILAPKSVHHIFSEDSVGCIDVQLANFTKIPWIWCLLHQVYKKFSHSNVSRSAPWKIHPCIFLCCQTGVLWMGKKKQQLPGDDPSVTQLHWMVLFSTFDWFRVTFQLTIPKKGGGIAPSNRGQLTWETLVQKYPR